MSFMLRHDREPSFPACKIKQLLNPRNDCAYPTKFKLIGMGKQPYFSRRQWYAAFNVETHKTIVSVRNHTGE